MKQIFQAAVVWFGLLIGSAQLLKAQDFNPSQEGVGPMAEMGTFQLIRTGKQEEAIQTDLLRMIEAKRHETDVTYYMLSQNTLVKILPKSEISKPDFKPLRDLYMEEKTMEGME